MIVPIELLAVGVSAFTSGVGAVAARELRAIRTAIDRVDEHERILHGTRSYPGLVTKVQELDDGGDSGE